LAANILIGLLAGKVGAEATEANKFGTTITKPERKKLIILAQKTAAEYIEIADAPPKPEKGKEAGDDETPKDPWKDVPTE